VNLDYTDASGSDADDSPAFGNARLCISLPFFRGAKKINSLSVYPLAFHPQKDQLVGRLIERGVKWARLDGCHHMRYDGVAYQLSQLRVRVSVAQCHPNCTV
jgi:hypothetical protein